MASEKYQLSEIIERLKSLGIAPKKSLGQNFLVNKETVSKIVHKGLEIQPDFILEIGPGLGALTEELFIQNKNLTLIELDRTFCELWREKGLTVIEGDALKVPWDFVKEYKNSLLVSNLPYQISASLVIDRSIYPLSFMRMVLMFQKEVAIRIASLKGQESYGLLSVIAQTFWKIEKLVDAGPKDFYPPPNVGSRVLCFDKKTSSIQNPELFLELVKHSFSQRRKKLKKRLEKRWSSVDWDGAFKKAGLTPDDRPQDVSVDGFYLLYQSLFDGVGALKREP